MLVKPSLQRSHTQRNSAPAFRLLSVMTPKFPCSHGLHAARGRPLLLIVGSAFRRIGPRFGAAFFDVTAIGARPKISTACSVPSPLQTWTTSGPVTTIEKPT
jgi:hypothetical protein